MKHLNIVLIFGLLSGTAALSGSLREIHELGKNLWKWHPEKPRLNPAANRELPPPFKFPLRESEAENKPDVETRTANHPEQPTALGVETAEYKKPYTARSVTDFPQKITNYFKTQHAASETNPQIDNKIKELQQQLADIRSELQKLFEQQKKLHGILQDPKAESVDKIPAGKELADIQLHMRQLVQTQREIPEQIQALLAQKITPPREPLSTIIAQWYETVNADPKEKDPVKTFVEQFTKFAGESGVLKDVASPDDLISLFSSNLLHTALQNAAFKIRNSPSIWARSEGTPYYLLSKVVIESVKKRNETAFDDALKLLLTKKSTNPVPTTQTLEAMLIELSRNAKKFSFINDYALKILKTLADNPTQLSLLAAEFNAQESYLPQLLTQLAQDNPALKSFNDGIADQAARMKAAQEARYEEFLRHQQRQQQQQSAPPAQAPAPTRQIAPLELSAMSAQNALDAIKAIPPNVAPEDRAHAILGVNTDADLITIRKAFRTLSLKFHPDKNPDKSPSDLEATDRIQTELNEAYKLLSSKNMPPA